MANIAGTWYSNQSYNPKFTYNISYSETGRSASAVSYRFDVSFNKINGWYGHDIIINWNIGGGRGSKTIKSTSDLGSGSITFNVTASTNPLGGTINGRIWTSSSTDGSHWQNQMDTNDCSVNKSTFNNPPNLTGGVTVSPSGIIPENTQSITITCNSASDPDNNLSGYKFWVLVNNSGWKVIGTSRTPSFVYDCSGHGEGTILKFSVEAYDGYNSISNAIYSSEVKKNTLIASTISTSDSIKYSDTVSTINLNVGRSSNTDGTEIKIRKLDCNEVTLYNGSSINTGDIELSIYKSGPIPNTPYIKIDDIAKILSGTDYIGKITLTVTTTNTYNTLKLTSVSINVDLQTNPAPVNSIIIQENSLSTAYRKVASTGLGYFIPDNTKTIQVQWSGGGGKLGETFTYSLFAEVGAGNWELLAENLNSSVRIYNHTISKINSTRTLRYKVRVVTKYGIASDNISGAVNLHYYNPPGISSNGLVRGSTTCEARIIVQTPSSIPNINSKGSWVCYNKGTSVTVCQGSLTLTQNEQTLRLTGLLDTSLYDLKVTYNDDTGFMSDQMYTISIPANTPYMFVNKYGIGIGGYKATSNYPLNVNGNAYIDGMIVAETHIKAVDFFAGPKRDNKVYHTGFKPKLTDLDTLMSNDSPIQWNSGAQRPGIFGHSHSDGSSWLILQNEGENKNNKVIIRHRSSGGVNVLAEFKYDAIELGQETSILGNKVLHKGWCGEVSSDAPQIKNMNIRMKSGWYAFRSPGVVGAPCPNGYLLVINANETNEYTQVAIGTNNSIYSRQFDGVKHGPWTSR